MEQHRVTTKIYTGSLRKLKVIAAHTGEHMPDVLARLLDREYEQVVEGKAPDAGETRIPGRGRPE